MGEDAALAIEDVPGVTLASLHAVVAAVTLQPDGSTSGLAQGHAALVVAVGGTADSCDVTRGQNRDRLAPQSNPTWWPATRGLVMPTAGVLGS